MGCCSSNPKNKNK